VPSNFRSEEDLDAFLFSQGVVGLFDIDTRALVKIIRERGVMNAVISDKPETDEQSLRKLQAYRIENAVNSVSCASVETLRAKEGGRSVVLWDFGAKRNIRNELVKRGCSVTSVPADTTAAEILALKPDGVMLSNGPGDPADNTGVICELAELCSTQTPIFGICLGHQLLALARGGQTMKLKYGHRGANQPVQEIATNKVYITSQNHGYAVTTENVLPENAAVSFLNLNDGTCEGLDYLDMPAFSVQFHPEACAGPLDTRYLFDRFITLMDTQSRA
jgi:carbamoyl-phosphate synthase small subunit